MKKLMYLAVICSILAACGGNSSDEEKNPYVMEGGSPEAQAAANANPSYDPERGEGKFSNVDISPKLDEAMATNGNKVYEVKCTSCHKLTDEKLVGPGWKDVTKRHTAEWIMNFATNPDVMLDKDPQAQAQLEICLVRMPNQNISDDEARAVYEFMRKNDGVN
ncbi:MAG: cytochrome c [Taibaiella sp.]|nr:cytochrome c [Taibaiella sp.]